MKNYMNLRWIILSGVFCVIALINSVHIQSSSSKSNANVIEHDVKVFEKMYERNDQAGILNAIARLPKRIWQPLFVSRKATKKSRRDSTRNSIETKKVITLMTTPLAWAITVEKTGSLLEQLIKQEMEKSNRTGEEAVEKKTPNLLDQEFVVSYESIEEHYKVLDLLATPPIEKQTKKTLLEIATECCNTAAMQVLLNKGVSYRLLASKMYNEFASSPVQTQGYSKRELRSAITHNNNVRLVLLQFCVYDHDREKKNANESGIIHKQEEESENPLKFNNLAEVIPALEKQLAIKKRESVFACLPRAERTHKHYNLINAFD